MISALRLAVVLLAAPTLAAGDCFEDAMIVFDGSGSMAETGFNQLDEPRIFEARRAIHDAVPPIAAVRRLGLVIYGPGGADGCTGLTVAVPPRADAAAEIIARVEALQPTGDTALTDAVALAAETLDVRNRPGSIVLITDGKETCGGAPCQLAAELAADAPGLTVHVIGFRVRGDFFAWGDTEDLYTEADTVAQCLAERTGGMYVRTESVDELIAALLRTLGCAALS